MAIANIVHSGFGFRCTATDTALPLTLGLDGSACWSVSGLSRRAGWWKRWISCLSPPPR